MFSFSNDAAEHLDEMKELEKKIEKNLSQLPDDWHMAEDIEEKLKALENSIEKHLNKLESSDFGAFERRVDDKFKSLLTTVQRHNQRVKRFLRQRNSEKKPSATLKASMRNLVDSLHRLIMYCLDFPLDRIKRKDIWVQLLQGLRSNKYLPPDIPRATAEEIIGHFTNTELLAVVRFDTTENPYLFVTEEGGNIETYIIKTLKEKPKEELLLSRIAKILDIRHMVIDYKHKMIDDSVVHLQMIETFRGKPVSQIGSMQRPIEITCFTYLLGAASADGFVLDLSDRDVNVLIDTRQFQKIEHETPEKYLGKQNPLFHIDYEFLNFHSAEKYLRNQITSSRGIVLYSLYQGEGVEKLSQDEIVATFVRGFKDELQRLEQKFSKNKRRLTELLERHNRLYLLERINSEYASTLSKIISRALRS